MLDILCIREHTQLCKQFSQPYIWKLRISENGCYKYCWNKKSVKSAKPGVYTEGETNNDFVILGAIVSNYGVRFEGYLESNPLLPPHPKQNNLFAIGGGQFSYVFYKGVIDILKMFAPFSKPIVPLSESELEEIGRKTKEKLDRAVYDINHPIKLKRI